jgi:hypothetical protein
MIFVINGARVEMHFLTKEVGIGSSSQYLLLEARISLVTSPTMTGVKALRFSEGGIGWRKCGDTLLGFEIEALRLLILSEKKEEN